MLPVGSQPLEDLRRGTGQLMRKPWRLSHPSSCRTSRCAEFANLGQLVPGSGQAGKEHGLGDLEDQLSQINARVVEHGLQVLAKPLAEKVPTRAPAFPGSAGVVSCPQPSGVRTLRGSQAIRRGDCVAAVVLMGLSWA